MVEKDWGRDRSPSPRDWTRTALETKLHKAMIICLPISFTSIIWKPNVDFQAGVGIGTERDRVQDEETA